MLRRYGLRATCPPLLSPSNGRIHRTRRIRKKAENWTATGSRQMMEDDRELKHLVSEDKGPMDVPSVCSSTVSVIGC